MSPITSARWTLILGTSFVFLYFGIEKFLHPDYWMGWMPSWIDGLLGLQAAAWLSVIGVTEIALGLLVLVPKRRIRRVAFFLCSLHLLGILADIGWNEIAVRDAGLLCMTMAGWYLTDARVRVS